MKKVYLGENKDPVYLKAEVRERNVTFFVSQDGTSYTQVGEVLDMRNLSDERVGRKWICRSYGRCDPVRIFMGMGSRQTLNGWITCVCRE